MDKGQRALTIDEIPLDWCFNDGVVLDFRHKADGERITVEDVQKELERIKYEIKPMDIVLIQTGADAAWGTQQYLVKGAGMYRDSTLFLTEKGVKVVGIDAWSWDRPLPFQAEEFKQNGDPKVIWEAHFAGIDIGYCHMEKMANLVGHRKTTWVYGLLFSGQDQRRQRGVDAAGGDHRRIENICWTHRPDEISATSSASVRVGLRLN